MAETQVLDPVELKFKQKYRMLRRVYSKLEKDNDRILFTLRRAKDAVQMLRTERSILFERLQKMDARKGVTLEKDEGVYELSGDSDTEQQQRQPPLVLLTPDEER